MNNKYVTEPAWGMVGFSRCQSSGTNLFQSDLKHRNFICLKIKTAQKSRGLHTDWVMGDEQLVEVWLSPTQFAELITCMNVGDGVPCTIKYTKEQGLIKYEPNQAELEVLKEELETEIDESFAKLDNVAKTIDKLLVGKKISKTVGEELLKEVQTANYILKNKGSNFFKAQAKEAIGKMATEAKTTVEAFVDHKLASLGLEALKNQLPLLETKKEDE